MKIQISVLFLVFASAISNVLKAQNRELTAVDMYKANVAMATASSVRGAIDFCKEEADWLNASATHFIDQFGHNAGYRVDFSTTWGEFKLILQVRPDGSDGLMALYQNEEFISSEIAYYDLIESSENKQLLIVFDTPSEFVAIYLDF